MQIQNGRRSASRTVSRAMRSAKRQIESIQIRAWMAERDARRATDWRVVSWKSLDLYTLAIDIAESQTQRNLLAQARTAMLYRLTLSTSLE